MCSLGHVLVKFTKVRYFSIFASNVLFQIVILLDPQNWDLTPIKNKMMRLPYESKGGGLPGFKEALIWPP